MSDGHAPLLEIKNLRTYFYVPAGTVKAVDGVDLSLDAGVKMGLVGESGSGKTTIALSLMRMIKPPGTVQGEIWLDGTELVKLSEEAMRAMRLSHLSYMPQGAMNSLNPVARIEAQIVDGMVDHGVPYTRQELKDRVTELLERVELSPRVARMYPHELSGGMKQRVCLAIAISMGPKLLIADEPTSALDVVIQRQVMDTITGLVTDLDLSMILIGHDMGLMAQSVDRLTVMYAGKIFEVGAVKDLFANPLNPYTRVLIDSLPVLGNRGVFKGIPGTPPSLINRPSGCPFHDRCPERIGSICDEQMPELVEVEPGRWVFCHLYPGD
jgi:oligopeptide/dipeptide ABC transporter ATP-binding protein